MLRLHYWVKMKDVNYEVNDYGQVRNLTTRNTLKPTEKKALGGYLYIRVRVPGANKRKNYYIHQLVANVFIPNDNPLLEVGHIIPDKYNNRMENLEWSTHAENMQEMFNRNYRR